MCRRGTQELFSAGGDRIVGVWNGEERAPMETLFGHQGDIVSVDCLAREVCAEHGVLLVFTARFLVTDHVPLTACHYLFVRWQRAAMEGCRTDSPYV